MDKLKTLVERCKASVSVEVNNHRGVYMTLDQWFEEEDLLGHSVAKDLDPDVRAKMIELDTLVVVQFYPHTPVGFYVVVHYDIDLALDQALACLDEEGSSN